MRHHKVLPISHLIHTTMEANPLSAKYQHQRIMQIWYQIFPNTEGQLIHSFVKGKVLYLKLKTSILVHKMKLQKQEIIKKIEKGLSSNDQNQASLQDIVFFT